MSKYIDAERLKEFLSNKYKEFTEKSKSYCFMQYQFMADGLNIAEQMVDSLQQEQQEMDLEEEIAIYLRTFSSSFENGIEYAKNIARHFYELGLNARKEE